MIKLFRHRLKSDKDFIECRQRSLSYQSTNIVCAKCGKPNQANSNMKSTILSIEQVSKSYADIVFTCKYCKAKYPITFCKL